MAEEEAKDRMIVHILNKSLEGIINLLFAIFPIEPRAMGLSHFRLMQKNVNHTHIQQREEKQKCGETVEAQK